MTYAGIILSSCKSKLKINWTSDCSFMAQSCFQHDMAVVRHLEFFIVFIFGHVTNDRLRICCRLLNLIKIG